MTFADLQLNQRIQSILSTQGFDTPTAIQGEAIPVILGNHDVLASAQTGTGKTAAFALPILHSLELSASREALKALILAPTRELA
ncbi:MAG: DEAD/DEAH box helicase, partial [Tannerellaceae bacterium]